MPVELSALRRVARDAIRAAIRGADAAQAVRRTVRLDGRHLYLQDRRLPRPERCLLVAAGKAAGPMAHALEGILGSHLADGLAVTPAGYESRLRRVRVLVGGHPLPTRGSVEAAALALRWCRSRLDVDLVVCAWSGGASALFEAPAPGISLADLRRTNDLLIRSGASIGEINAVRKHLSRVKGGQLAQARGSGRVLSLVLSDVVGDDLAAIASGPTYPDATTFHDCVAIARKYGLQARLPAAVRRRLRDGAASRLPETPKPGEADWDRVTNVVVGNNTVALDAVAAVARRAGFNTHVLSAAIEGDTTEAARLHVAVAREIAGRGLPVAPPACVLSGGETTVRVTGNGKGGRNQQFALAAVRGLASLPGPAVLASLATDGADGPTDAAGAVSDGETAARAERLGLAPPEAFLAANDAYHYFGPLGDLIRTGPTRTNVMDVHVLLVG